MTLTATDGAGNSASGTATVEVRDGHAPVITSCASDLVLATDAGICTRTLAPADLLAGFSAQDNCDTSADLDASLVFARSDGATELAAPFAKGTTTITYTVSDGAGLTAACTQTITVKDQEAPVIHLADQTVFAGCGTGATFTGASATDNCGAVSVATDPAPGTELAAGVYLIAASATDPSGNTATRTATLQIVERVRVVFESPLEDDNLPDDINGDADVMNRFKVGSTLPHKVTLFDCKGRDVTELRAGEVTVTLAVVEGDVTDVPTAVNDVPTLYHGVGSGSGVMTYVGGHFQLNRFTKDLVAGVMYRSIVWVEWRTLPGLVAGVEDAAILGR